MLYIELRLDSKTVCLCSAVFVNNYVFLQVRHGCDATCWGPGPGGCLQTLLHRAIDENNEPTACFLIRRSESPASLQTV